MITWGDAKPLSFNGIYELAQPVAGLREPMDLRIATGELWVFDVAGSAAVSAGKRVAEAANDLTEILRGVREYLLSVDAGLAEEPLY